MSTVAAPDAQSTPVRSASAYGWVIVGLVFLSTGLVLGSRFTLGMFLPYLPDALGASAADVSGAFAVAMLGAAVCQPFTGWLLDRLGGRAVLSIGLACAGVALIGTSMADALWQVTLLMGVTSSFAYAAVSPVSATSIVSSWFDKRKGAALGVATSGTKVAMVVLPPVFALTIALAGWRATMMGFGIVITLLIPAMMLFLKPAPGSAAALKAAERKAARDGAAEAETPGELETPAVPPAQGATLREALAVPAFWLIAISLFANGLIMNLVFIHLPNYVLEQGYGESIAALGLAVLGFVGIFGTVVTGALSDRMGRRNVMLVMFGARGVTALAVVLAPGPVTLAAFVLVFGLLGYGAIGVIGSMSSELFGRRAIGAILGTAYVFNQVGGAAGTYAGGLSLEWTGDYSAALWLAIITTILSFLCILGLPKDRKAG